jgi:hypothetical protein
MGPAVFVLVAQEMTPPWIVLSLNTCKNGH